jgi:ABC-type transport system involved in multi-copper enzyme maturation permease subunit
MLYVLLLVLALCVFGLANGNLRIASGDTSVGGTKAWITSQFNVAQVFTFLVFLLYTFFIAVAAGMSVIRDDEERVGELLHSTLLRPAEYLWGKFGGVLAAFVLVLGVHLALTVFFFQFFPIERADELRGPFALGNYLVPALLFALPTIVFFAGTSFAVGERTRHPILVMVLPVAFVVVSIFFLWDWSPSWLDPRIDALLMIVDPSGFRWLHGTWLEVDRGVAHYNQAPIGLDATFWLNRAWILVAGLGSVAWSVRRFAHTLRADEPVRRRWWRRRPRAEAPSAEVAASTVAAGEAPSEAAALTVKETPGLATLEMRVEPRRFLAGIWQVMRVELRELRSQPGLYLFVPLVILQTVGSLSTRVGPFDTPVLLTSGTVATGTMNTLTLLVTLLLLFYTVESLARERSTGFASIYYATPVRTASILFGKCLANSVVAVVILLATLVGCAIALGVQGETSLRLGPFVVVWGLLLAPTFLLFTSFVTALHALVRERYTTYAVALAALAGTGWAQATGKMTWVWNWNLWAAVQWSDMGPLELDRTALALNRATALGATVFFVAVSVALFARRDLDHGRLLERLRPRPLARTFARAAPFLVLPVVTGTVLAYQVRHGTGGEIAEQRAKDYWRKNLATWKDAPVPSIRSVDVELELDPERSFFRAAGTYRLRNHLDEPLRALPMTVSWTWEDLTFTLDGEPFAPEDREGLFVFHLPAPLAPGDELEVGFSHHGVFPHGPTRNGGEVRQFILPSGVVLHIFAPTFLPLPGYVEEIGVDDDNRYEPREYPDDHYRRVLEPAFGITTPFSTRVAVTAPIEYTVNSVGTLVEERTAASLRTVVWESDHPVKLLNVVAGRWDVRRRDGTAVFFHPEHTYNVDEISNALVAARRRFSEWFYPYPWRELKLSEFPALANYAQGFPTNITFSEGIGFLTESDPKTNLAFMVTAHEAAHQWWGNILTPAEGTGGNILSEGMAHFSTILLMEAEKGERERIELCRRIEERYSDRRQLDSERPLVKIDGSRAGDTTVTYDKGGWVMWMLTDLMGREAALAGLRDLFERFADGPDHPLLEDLVETLRPHAPDPEAFDRFVGQWYFDVVVPEYRLRAAEVTRTGTAFETRVTIENRGSGRMPVEVAAVRGERFPEAEGEDAEPDAARDPYREARTTVVLGAGESADLTLPSDFEPERLVVDPDARVLQLERDAALLRL